MENAEQAQALRNFAALLRKHREDRQLTKLDLARQWGRPVEHLIALEEMESYPSANDVQTLAHALDLNISQTERLFHLATLASGKVGTGKSQVVPIVGNVARVPSPSSAYEGQRVLTLDELMGFGATKQQADLEELRGAVGSLVATVSEIKARIQDPAVQASAQSAIEAATHVEEISEGLKAPIYFPVLESLGVQLVPLTEVDRINEYREEESKWYTVGAVLVGVMLGIVQNVVTGGVMTPYAWTIIIASGLLALLCGWTAWRYGTKARLLRQQASERRWVEWVQGRKI